MLVGAKTEVSTEEEPSDEEVVVPALTPNQFLLISSPSQAKIVYTHLANFRSDQGVARALVDSGLSQPRGLALDRTHGFLYIADSGLKKIVRYRLLVDHASDGISLTTDGVQLTILDGHEVEWVACDLSGDVFFSDRSKKFVGHLTYQTVDMIAKGEAYPGYLEVVSMSQLEEKAKSDSAKAANGTLQPDFEVEMPKAQLLSLYEAEKSDHVHAPSGVASDGIRIYWGNELGGSKYGSVVRGETYPTTVVPASTEEGAGEKNATALAVNTNTTGTNNGSVSFPATPLAVNTNTTYGVAKSSKMVLFASDGGPNTSAFKAGYVYGVADGSPGGVVFALASTLMSPRGLCWDGDQTVYVADEGADAVYSLPVGRLADNVPLEKSVNMVGPYGVAMLSASDEAWKSSSPSSGATGRGPTSSLCLLMAVMAFVAAPLR